MSEEIWLPVVGYEGLYEVSSRGKVKSLARTCASKNEYGEYKRHLKTHIMSSTKDKNGYVTITLNSNNTKKTHSVHRLVGYAFIPNPDNLPQINHLDSCRSNNFVSNLEWVTNSANQLHAFKHGNQNQQGSKCSNSKLTEKDVLLIRELIKKGHELKEIAKMFQVIPGTISCIKCNRTWTHVK